MGQRRFLALAVLLLAALAAGCDRAIPPAVKAAPEPRVASVTPAGTDLILGIGAGEHLVGISNFDPERLETHDLPRIGDYENIDWEKLATLRPQVLVIQYGNDRIPPMLLQRCDERGIKAVNIHLDVLNDVYHEMATLGQAIGEGKKAADAAAKLREQIDGVKARVAKDPVVKTLVVDNDGASGLGVVGAGNFIDDLLTIAGGRNAAAGLNGYVTIDREKLLSLAPDAVIQLMPDARPQEVEQAERFWSTVPELPAVKHHRVYRITKSYALEPGSKVGDLAEEIAGALHPPPATGPATQPAATSTSSFETVTAPLPGVLLWLHELLVCHPERSEGSRPFERLRSFASLRMTNDAFRTKGGLTTKVALAINPIPTLTQASR